MNKVLKLTMEKKLHLFYSCFPQVASDDSDVDSSGEEVEEKQHQKRKKSSSKLVTIAMINRWSRDMRVSKSILNIGGYLSRQVIFRFT